MDGPRIDDARVGSLVKRIDATGSIVSWPAWIAV